MQEPSPRVLARRRQIGARIRDARTWANLSQERLAELAELSRKTVYRVELGDRAARIDWLIVIADVLEVPLSDLVREQDEAPDGEGVGGD